ncbi:MAG: VacJ family lipoprotein [Burkholderiaceae bacterium]
MRAARRRLQTLAAAVTLLASACATIPPDAGRDPVDPLERINRHVFEFNDRIDRAVLKPVAQGYVAVVPEPVRGCVTNFFANLGDVANAANNLLQGKPVEAVSDICRIAINTTIGVLGCFDVASKMGLEKHNEDFGQTLGRWGIGSGAYLVLPLLGPSSVRDAVGRVPDAYVDPARAAGENVRARNALFALETVDLRARLLDAGRLLDAAALDKYRFTRDAYLQRRRNLVYDGNPPRDEDDDEEPVKARSVERTAPTDGAGASAEPRKNDQPGIAPAR